MSWENYESFTYFTSVIIFLPIGFFVHLQTSSSQKTKLYIGTLMAIFFLIAAGAFRTGASPDQIALLTERAPGLAGPFLVGMYCFAIGTVISLLLNRIARK